MLKLSDNQGFAGGRYWFLGWLKPYKVILFALSG
jgi:hypothetical protein